MSPVLFMHFNGAAVSSCTLLSRHAGRGDVLELIACICSVLLMWLRKACSHAGVHADGILTYSLMDGALI